MFEIIINFSMVVILLHLWVGTILYTKEQTFHNLRIAIIRLVAPCSLVGDINEQAKIKNVHTRENIKSHNLYGYIRRIFVLFFYDTRFSQTQTLLSLMKTFTYILS
jgi:hypothetical protein